MLSVACRLLLPLLPPAGFSTEVVLMAALLVQARSGLPVMKLGRTTQVMVCVSPLAMLPTVQVTLAAPVITSPALRPLPTQLPLLVANEMTVAPGSPPGMAKVSVTTTFCAMDGPLLR